MTVHRSHPVTGPWPYEVDVTRDYGGVEPPLISRIPVEGSVIFDDPPDALLFDDCERCAQHASHPLGSLDPVRLGGLWLEMVGVEHTVGHRDHYRTRAEADACRALYAVALMVERTHPAIDAWTWPWTVRPPRLPFRPTRIGVDGVPDA